MRLSLLALYDKDPIKRADTQFCMHLPVLALWDYTVAMTGEQG